MRYTQNSRNGFIVRKPVFYFIINIIIIFIMFYLLIISGSPNSIQFIIMISSCFNLLYLSYRKFVKNENIANLILITFTVIFIFSSMNFISRM